jgi:DNA-directed RNA polymerase specialized sigma24 family protein
VAVNIVRERWRKSEQDPRPLAAVPSKPPAVDPFEAQRSARFELQNERRLGCLEECVDRLTPMSRDLLTAYHLGGSGLHIGRRKSLADRLNVPAATLRLRIYRIRRQLEGCVSRCIGAETFQEGGH